MAMTDDDRAAQPEAGHNSIKRRGLLAAVWAAVAGVALKYTTQPVEAQSYVVLGGFNTESTQTTIFRTAVNGTAMQVACTAVGGTAAGLVSTGSGNGVVAYKNGAGPGAGVFGQAETPESSGIYGNGFSASGVSGVSNTGAGVLGQSISGNPILGQVTAGSSANTIAIYGVNNSTYAGPGPGAGGFGVYGLSAKGHGLVGATAAAGGAAVVGATNGVAGAWGGAFYGRVIVGGDFMVVGGAKSAAVPHPDGSHRLLYCVESPESWFEDFGKGQLECGRADVAIDPDFASVADMSDYHVFLTQYDYHNDLCVTEPTPTGFRVLARNADTNAKFSWRVVAKRKDIVAARLAPVTIPKEPTLPPVPDVPPPVRPVLDR